MKKVDLKTIEHQTKIGDTCGDIEPNITEDCLFLDNGEVVGLNLLK